VLKRSGAASRIPGTTGCARTHNTAKLCAMRMHPLLLIVAGLSATCLAAPAPLTFPELSANAITENDCFTAARDQKADPAPCDALLHGAAADPWTLAITHNNKGLILGTIGEHEKALGEFDAALELAPELVQAQINRGNTLMRLGRYREALDAYDRAVSKATVNQHVALFNRALAHAAFGNLDQAASDLAAARHQAAAQ